MEQADILVKADFILTMDSSLTTLEPGAVAVRDGRILAVGPSEELERTYDAGVVLGGSGTVAFPGLANTHTHAPMVFFRGLADDLPLRVWLEEHIWPAEDRWLSAEFVSDATELACLEMLTAGVTVFNDMYFFGDAIAETAKKLGMRAVVGAGILDFPSKTAGSTDEYLANAERFIGAWKGDNLIVPAVAPHAPYTCSPDTLRKARDLADRFGVPLHIHLSETQWEVAEVQRRYGKTPISLLDHIGILDERVIAAHCVWPIEEEISILAERKVGVAHCVESNLKLASGMAPVVPMLKAGVRVAFGTDGAASNNDLSILSEMATAAKLHKAVSGDPTALGARQAMLMATRWGAEVLGLGQVSGSIEAGKAADIVIAALDRPHLTPLYDVYSQIVYAMGAADIETVLVNGRIVLDGGRLVTASEEEILSKARDWGRKIRHSG